ncbi:unnamed protein product, partial [marine sediment metagenome]
TRSSQELSRCSCSNNPQDYPIILEELEKNQGEISLEIKKRLATEVFEHTSFYDGIITHYLRKNLLKKSTSFPRTLNLLGEKVSDLRYGENPHQFASFYKEVLVKEVNLGDAVQLGGKELSFNNLVDLGAVLEMVKDAQVKVKLISEVTNFPEILDGRVKTLHPLIFGGILARSDNPLHQEQLVAQQIKTIGLVVVNLYPFQKTISKEEVKLGEAIENIDIGGPSLLRAAAKNYQDVAVVINPQDYPIILEELEKNQGEISLEIKKRLATEVFEHTS